MSEREIRPGRLTGRLLVPGSRSLTNRALVVAALADGTSELLNPLEAEDTVAMRAGLRALGVTIDDSEPERWLITGTGGDLRPPAGPVDVGASGTTARFLTAVAALVPGTVEVVGSQRMAERPIGDLIGALRQMGVSIALTGTGPGPPVEVIGNTAIGGLINIDARHSSQYVSALAMIAPLLQPDTELVFVGGTLVSRPYVEMTVDVMCAFGADVDFGDQVRVRGGRGYRSRVFEIEPDHSSAVYPAAGAALTGGRLVLAGVRPDSNQADRVFFDVLQEMGAGVEWMPDHVVVSGIGRLRAIQRDMGDAPDAALMAIVLAAFAEGSSRISNIGNLRIKESDRLAALSEQLNAMGVQTETGADYIEVDGGLPHAATIDTYDDHRIAMSFAVAGLAVPGTIIRDPGCVAKTWPGFFEVLESLTEFDRLPGRMVIAIDGPGGSGKTTVSRAVGERLGLPHLDTGAFYRAATLAVVEAGVAPEEEEAVFTAVRSRDYGYRDDRMLLDRRDVSEEIRSDEVTRAASPVSAISSVRRLLVERQRAWVAERGGAAVVEGRDIGTVVFPDAGLKIFLTARSEVRAERRAAETGATDVEKVVGELARRDTIDSSRKDSPLAAADDAIVIDTSDMTFDEVVETIVAEARRRSVS